MIGALAAVVIWYMRLPAFVWYTSPPFDSGRYRIQVLVPRGWELNASLSHLLGAGEMVRGGAVLTEFRAVRSKPLVAINWEPWNTLTEPMRWVSELIETMPLPT